MVVGFDTTKDLDVVVTHFFYDRHLRGLKISTLKKPNKIDNLDEEYN